MLKNLVVLKPNWITKAISCVLTDETTGQNNGILAHADLPRIWTTPDPKDKTDERPYDRALFPTFLRLMERFYLSYQIEPDLGQTPSHSLIPLLLPYQPPADLPPWPETPPEGQMQVEMLYRFDFVPPGLMSWFIVRTHRYTTNQHWRDGMVLAYRNHWARIEIDAEVAREIRLVVWGVQPHTFFTILKETLEQILELFEGLSIQRLVPCICHWEAQPDEPPCAEHYRYDKLEQWMEDKRFVRECDASYREVDVRTLLFGIHPKTEPKVIEEIQVMRSELSAGQQQLSAGQHLILERQAQQSEWIARLFTRQWNLELRKMEIACPSTFLLMPGRGSRFNPKNLLSQSYHMYLMCQYPEKPHIVGDGYELRQANQTGEFLQQVSPWLTHLLKYLKYAVPVGGLVEVADETMDILKDSTDLLDQIQKQMSGLKKMDALERLDKDPRLGERQQAVGAALRALNKFLNEIDPGQAWGDLRDTPTPDGNILWLCPEHRETYIAKPLDLATLPEA